MLRPMLRHGLLAIVGLAGCNALTGASDLEVADDAPIALPDGGRGALDAAPAPSPPDRPATDAATSDASATDAGCTIVSSGPRYGTVATALEWANAKGALQPDGLAAQTSGTKDPLVVRGFGFALPAGATTITGIEVAIARSADGTVADDAIALTKGAPKAGGAWPPGGASLSFATATYGGPTDTWGTTWTADEIASPDFRVSLRVKGFGIGRVDSVAVTVSYCAP